MSIHKVYCWSCLRQCGHWSLHDIKDSFHSRSCNGCHAFYVLRLINSGLSLIICIQRNILQWLHSPHALSQWEWISTESENFRKPLLIKNERQYWYYIWEWRFHSITAAMDFPLRGKITGGYPIKIHYRQEANHYILTQNGIAIPVHFKFFRV